MDQNRGDIKAVTPPPPLPIPFVYTPLYESHNSETKTSRCAFFLIAGSQIFETIYQA